MAKIAAGHIDLDGVSIADADFSACAALGDTFDNNGNVFVIFKNTGTEKTVTVDSVRPSDYGTDVNPTIVVPANTGRVIAGPFDPTRFNQADGTVKLTYSSETALMLRVVRF